MSSRRLIKALAEAADELEGSNPHYHYHADHLFLGDYGDQYYPHKTCPSCGGDQSETRFPTHEAAAQWLEDTHPDFGGGWNRRKRAALRRLYDGVTVGRQRPGQEMLTVDECPNDDCIRLTR